ncbi:MAG: aminotransferase class V-fold PLP-dependent enzyme [Pseudomonadota bacterium]
MDARPTPDWDTFRSAFPALNGRTYLNTAGGAPLSRAASAAGALYYEEMLADGDAQWPDWLARADAVRAKFADLVNALPDDIAFLSSASAAMNAVTGYLDPEDPIVTVADEFPSVTLPWINRGHPVTAIPVDADGGVSIDRIADAVADGTGAIVVSHVQFRTGRRLDLSALGAIADRKGALLIVDATQSAGAIPIDLNESSVSILMASGYKWLCAGYGIGAVYLSPRLRERRPPVYGWRSAAIPYALDPVAIDPTPTAVQLEMGHPPLAPVFALGGALDHLASVGIDAAWSRIVDLEARLRTCLAASGLPEPLGPAGESGIAVLPCSHGAAIKQTLAAENVFVTSSGPYLRLSVHAYNTPDDVEHGVDRLAAAWRTAEA